MEALLPHAAKARTATPRDAVINSECVYTFHTPYTTPKGIVVSLSSFVGTAEELAEDGLCVRIAKRRERRGAGDGDGDGDGGEKPTKLGMGVEGGFRSDSDEYRTVSAHSVVLISDGEPAVELPYDESTEASFPREISSSADSIIRHAGLAAKQDLTAWEMDADPKPTSKYAECLPFVDNGVKIPSDPKEWRCEKTGEKTEHLWLNLSDGFVGGGRKNWDGSGGTNGALDHFEETGRKYPLVVKLGTITDDVSTADCYSYAPDEDGPVVIPNLKELLEKRGIVTKGMQKTVKSTSELEVELNASYAFDAIVEKGRDLIPVSGPGMVGLQNLGNSCYVNSVVQMLFGGSVAEMAKRYGCRVDGDVTSNPLLEIEATKAPDDVLCQAAKLASALTSGAFCAPIAQEPSADPSSADPKYRLAPRMFKYCVGGDHVDFRTGQQQDAAQYLQYLLEKLDRAELGGGARLGKDGAPALSSHLFSYKTETRLVCEADGRVMYKTSPKETMLSLRIPMSKATVPSECPEVKRQKSEEVDEDKEKRDVPTVTFDACIDEWAATSTVEDYRWNHLQNSVSKASSKLSLVNFPRYLLIQMQRYEIGDDWQPKKIEVKIDVPEEISLEKYKASGPQDGENLVPEDMQVDSPPAPAAPSIDEGALAQLMDMGFTMNGCKRALMAIGGSNVEAAMNWVFEHNMDPDFNDPMPEGDAAVAALSGGSNVDEGVVTSLVENLGCFTADQVRAAVKHCDGAADRAADWLFSHMDDLDGAIAALERSAPASVGPAAPPVPLEDGAGKYTLIGLVSHIGKNTGSGHYVAHLKKQGKWVIFNDEKVALSQDPPIEHAYMYLFVRNDTVGSPHPEF